MNIDPAHAAAEQSSCANHRYDFIVRDCSSVLHARVVIEYLQPSAGICKQKLAEY
jgi:hypothetical protein